MNDYNSTLSGAEYNAIFEQQKHRWTTKINNLGRKVGTAFDEMAAVSKAMGENQANQRKLGEEQDKLYKTKDIILDAYSEEAGLKENGILRLGYHLLPIMDMAFAWFAVRPIMVAKCADYGMAFAEIAGLFIALIVGYVISMISRIAMASVEDNRWKPIAIICSIILLPLLYIVSEVGFNGGQSWIYSGSFAFISLTIQMLIVLGFRRQTRALNQHKNRTAEAWKSIRKDEKALKKQLRRLTKEAKALRKDFKKATDNFTAAFRDIVTASESYLAEYENSIFIPVGNDARYLGNAICFQREALPICHTDEIVFSKNLQYISYMYNEIGAKISLDEYLDTERRQEAAPPPQENEQVA